MQQQISDTSALEQIAEESGIAVALVDAGSNEVFVTNNNSICRTLNPQGKFTTHCKAFCGTAFEEATEFGSAVSYTCHAGLECRVVPVVDEGHPLVAILGRTFLTAENYRRATTRAISGDWKDHSPSEFFENILLTGSVSTLDRATEEIKSLFPERVVKETSPAFSEISETRVRETEFQGERREPDDELIVEQKVEEHSEKRPVPVISNIVAKFNRELGLVPETPKHDPQPSIHTESEIVTESPILPFQPVAVERKPEETGDLTSANVEADLHRSREKRAAEAKAWRSFFGSLLKTDYGKAKEAILEFVALQYGLSAMVWLEKNEKRLENTAAYGAMKNRKVRLGIAADDVRLIQAAHDEMPLEINERPRQDSSTAPRTMYLFPIGVSGEISAGIAVLENISDDKVKRQIARVCQSLAPQLEILKLRSQVARGESLSTAVRRFSESLRNIDADDLWIKLTQNAAEMLKAERASLMVFDERTNTLEIKALIGGLGRPGKDEIVGERVARLVFDKNKPIIVPDVTKTGLPPAAASRQYKTASFLSCPLSISGRTIGVMSFADKASGRPFDRSSLNLLQAIAPQIAVAIDRASLKEKAGEFEQLSVTDALTGLLNRRYIEARLMEEVKRSNRHGFPMSFMMIDVDHFKSYNDQFGHPAGDVALKMVGQVIRETLRGADVAARFGGEEFSILLPQTTSEEAAMIGERIRANIAESPFPNRQVTASIGIASCSAELCSAVDLVSAADKALYEAKNGGRNRVLTFEKLAS